MIASGPTWRSEASHAHEDRVGQVAISKSVYAGETGGFTATVKVVVQSDAMYPLILHGMRCSAVVPVSGHDTPRWSG
jgi:hypothetical protein